MVDKYRKIVLNVPHSSIEGVFERKYSGWSFNSVFINECLIKWTDWHTDFLFNSNDDRIEMIRFPLSRFIVDVERLTDDPLESIGQGIIYTKFKEFHRNIDDDTKIVLMNIYNNHINTIKQALSEDSILIDCHSFPSELSNIDICIGYNNDWSKPTDETIDMIVSIFQSIGYKVGINTPYSNSLAPQVEFCYKSIMIEVNKKTYLKEGNILDYTGCCTLLKPSINKVYSKLLK